MVIGGSGILGAWVTRALIEYGQQPVVFSRNPDMRLLSDIRDSLEVEAGDVLDLPSLIRAIHKHQTPIIVNMATIVPPKIDANPYRGFMDSMQILLNVMEGARLAGVRRVLFASSKAVYREITDEHGPPTFKPVSEDYPKWPKSVYGIQKLACEQLGNYYAEHFGIEFMAFRFGATYGPMKVIRHGPMLGHGQMVENAMLGKATRIPRGADHADDVVYARDVGHALALGCLSTKVTQPVFNIGTGRLTTLTEMADAVRDLFPNAAIEIGPGRAELMTGRLDCVMDISRAREELGYEPRYDPLTGVRDYVETMRKLHIEPTHIP
ncbi:NAD-dependent epimerase/dehydratase family protein [Thermodesulfobacteriota bacterium]